MDRQTDGQTDGFAIAYSMLSMLSRAKNDKQRSEMSQHNQIQRQCIHTADQRAGCTIQPVSTAVNTPALTGAGMALQSLKETIIVTPWYKCSYTE